MKYNNIIKSFAACSVGFLLMGTSCTDLDEELFGQLSPDTYYQNEEEALSSVAGVYERMTPMVMAANDGWRIGEYSTDECFAPGRGGGWWDDYVDEIAMHAVKPDNGRNSNSWASRIFPAIGCANAVIESLEASPKADDFKAMVAECRAIRAFEYFWAMEYWGNIPVFTGGRVDPNDLPKQYTVKEVYDFIETELKEAADALPSAKDVGSDYYPRLTKEAVQCRLAQLYIMGEFYTGTARWADCESVCDEIIATGAFGLEAKVGDCFREDMEGKSVEVMSAIAVDANVGVGQGGNDFWLYCNGPWDNVRYGCSVTAARGYATSDEALNRYEAGDERLELIEHGYQYDLNGNAIDVNGKVVPEFSNIVYLPVTDDNKNIIKTQIIRYERDKSGVKIDSTKMSKAEDEVKLDTVHLCIKAMTNKNDSKNDEGYVVLKYTPVGATWIGNSLNNDFILDRFSNVLLLKCESMFRQSKTGADSFGKTALDYINQVRNRSELADLTSDQLTLRAIEVERANEFIWEGQRRRDSQRFGSFFTETNWWKTSLDEDADRHTQFFPIPAQQLAANPNLKQNPGY